MTLRAVLFVDGAPRAFLSGSIRQFNANTGPGRTWREIDEDIARLEDVPPLVDLMPHPDLDERD